MKSIRRVLRVVVLLLLVPTAGGAAELPEDCRKEIAERVAHFLERSGVPGISVAIGVENELCFEQGYGLTDVENQVPASAHSIYRLASISKMLTGVAVLQLAEAGKLDLAVPIQSYVSSFPEKQAPITCDLLLKHQSGIRHYKGDLEVRSNVHYLHVRDSFEIFQDDPLLFHPGERFSYTTYGFNVLGAAIESASGEDYVGYVEKHIAEPSGMTTLQPDSPFAIIPHRAAGYRKQGKKLLNDFGVDISNKIPGGGWCSTAGDLIRFAGALNSGKLLDSQMLEKMWTPQKTAAGEQTNAGYGCFIDVVDDDRLISHSGGQPKVSTFLVFSPAKKIAVAVMCNLRDSSPKTLALDLIEVIGAEVIHHAAVK
jgi:CubicO group peptidase (beta-lactamase class C family)